MSSQRWQLVNILSQIWLTYLAEAGSNIMQDHACSACRWNGERFCWLLMEHKSLQDDDLTEWGAMSFIHTDLITRDVTISLCGLTVSPQLVVFVLSDLYVWRQLKGSKGTSYKEIRAGYECWHNTWVSVVMPALYFCWYLTLRIIKMSFYNIQQNKSKNILIVEKNWLNLAFFFKKVLTGTSQRIAK